MQVITTHGDKAAGQEKSLVWHRFDTGRLCYNEALLKGRYVTAGFSAMGRPMVYEQLIQEIVPPDGLVGAIPWHRRASSECAFAIEIDGTLLDGYWSQVSSESELIDRGPDREAVVQNRTVLKHGFVPVAVTVVTTLDDTSIFARCLEIENKSKKHLRISRAASWSGRIFRLGGWDNRHSWQSDAFTVSHFPDIRFGNEGHLVIEPLEIGGRIFSSSTGRSGQGYPAVMITNNRTGETFVCNLQWSGNWRMESIRENDSNRDERDEVFFSAGLSGPAPVYLLGPGEIVVTPVCHVGWVYGDLDHCVAEIHGHMRRSVISRPERSPNYPVEFNNSGFTQNRQTDEQSLYDHIDVAYKAGVELFTIDAGWFGDRDEQWYELVGDWKESRQLAGKLQRVFEKIHSVGMLGGLWVEIERMARKSDLAKKHPEWWLSRHGETYGQLDLTIPEVANHLYEKLCDLIDRYKLDCFRLDYNLRQGEGGERIVNDESGQMIENSLWRYFDALNNLFDRIATRYPELLLENCAGGGGRMDLGMMSRFHWTQVSDNWDPVPTLKIINGMLYALLPEQAMTLIGAVSQARADLDFALRISLFGHMCLSGIYPSDATIHAESADRWGHVIELYKSFVRPFLQQSRVHHHTRALAQNEPGDWSVLELAAADGSRSMIGVWRLYEPGDHTIRVRPRGIAADRRYRLTFDNSSQSVQANGLTLMNDGIAVSVAGNLCSELLLFEAI